MPITSHRRACSLGMVYPRTLRLGNHIHDESNHDVLVLGVRFRNQERQRRESHVIDDRPIVTCEPPVAMQKFDEKQRRNPLVPIRKGVVLDDEVEQVRGFRLNRWISSRLAEYALVEISQ